MPPFNFQAPFGDARLEEMKLLAAAAECNELDLFIQADRNTEWRDLLVSLVSRGMLTTFDYRTAKESAASAMDTEVKLTGFVNGRFVFDLMNDVAMRTVICALYERKQLALRITHEGRLRLSELKQALRTGREREPFGILWDTRHWEQDLQVALVDAKPGAPLAVAYLDMNGLKPLNDAHGHDAGDRALRAYFQAVASVLGDHGQAYRLGGDEVLAIIPGHDAARASPLLQAACRSLMAERLGLDAQLSIAAGIAVATDPATVVKEVRTRADATQYRAKELSRQSNPRPSVIATEGVEEMLVIKHGGA